MISVEYLFLADEVEVESDQINARNIGVTVFWAPRVPCPLPSLRLVGALRVGWNDAGIPYRAKVTIIDADGNPIIDHAGTFPAWEDTPERPPGVPDGVDFFVPLIADLDDITLPRFGTYELQLWIDEKSVGRVTFFAESTERGGGTEVSHFYPPESGEAPTGPA